MTSGMSEFIGQFHLLVQVGDVLERLYIYENAMEELTVDSTFPPVNNISMAHIYGTWPIYRGFIKTGDSA